MPTIISNPAPDINGFLSGETITFSVTSLPGVTDYSYEWYLTRDGVTTLVCIGNTYIYIPNDLDSVFMKQINCNNIQNTIKAIDTFDQASLDNAGAFKYQEDAFGSYLFISMKITYQGNITYGWVNIKENIF